MKRFLMICAAVAFVPALISCAGGKAKKADATKILVAYYSATGTTAKVAADLASVTGGDLYEIRPVTPYSDEDLDWRNQESRSSVEMKDPSWREPFVEDLQGADSYDVIYIGFPIWWNTAPTVINSFIEKYGFEGKTVILFGTSGGSTLDNAVKVFREAYPDINWKSGKTLNNLTTDELKAWVGSL
ncbi:MAG: flavodoxin [Bacteroidales bacterium]|nr:flavodoxin [Bacteroidales bacterium]MBQ9174758.1 flavodoxin [Bacteroidales bacterium]MBQ9713389.1 flavodoxin [Bacteroidales bacterium]MBR1434980.1 flavodoxin [Bacteroidales bacterium]